MMAAAHTSENKHPPDYRRQELERQQKESLPPYRGGGYKILHGIGSHETEYNTVDTSVTISYKITWFAKVSCLH